MAKTASRMSVADNFMKCSALSCTVFMMYRNEGEKRGAGKGCGCV